MAVVPLSAEQRDALDSGLALAAALAGGARPLNAAQVQDLYDCMRGKDGIEPARGVIGLAFGELILTHGPFEWVRVSDELGSETSIAVMGYDLHCYPISMIERRLEADEGVEIEMLARQTASELKKLVETGSAATR